MSKQNLIRGNQLTVRQKDIARAHWPGLFRMMDEDVVWANYAFPCRADGSFKREGNGSAVWVGRA